MSSDDLKEAIERIKLYEPKDIEQLFDAFDNLELPEISGDLNKNEPIV